MTAYKRFRVSAYGPARTSNRRDPKRRLTFDAKVMARTARDAIVACGLVPGRCNIRAREIER